MAITIDQLATHLVNRGIPHHVDAEQHVIRLLLPTQRYRSVRGEHLAIITIEVGDGGQSCLVSLSNAFRPDGKIALACLAICESLQDYPVVAVRPGRGRDTLELVAAVPVEDGSLTPEQLFALIDQVYAAAEEAQATLAGNRLPGRRRVA